MYMIILRLRHLEVYPINRQKYSELIVKVMYSKLKYVPDVADHITNLQKSELHKEKY